jgi:hypothetical protein
MVRYKFRNARSEVKTYRSRARKKLGLSTIGGSVPRKKKIDIGMEHGIMWSAAYLVQAHGQDTLAEYMLQESGFDPNTCGDEYDRNTLKGVIESINKKKQV